MPHRDIDVLIFDGVNLLDVAGPVQAFHSVQVQGKRPYKMRFVSLDGQAVQTCCGLRLEADGILSSDSIRDDLLIPGGEGVNGLIPNPDLRRVIRHHAARPGDGRLMSICSGALLLAEAGVLDGINATTHWTRAAHVKSYPDVAWDLDQISTATDRIFTSAGVTTGIDLALAIIRADWGPSVALAVARELVIQLRRTGGQSQYAIHLAGQFSQDDALTRLIEQVVAQPHLDWSLDQMATTAGLNARTLSRHFQRDMQVSPAQFVERVRVDHARGLLADQLPLKQVAADSGFGDLQRMRRAFKRRFGVHVSAYINTFGGETKVGTAES